MELMFSKSVGANQTTEELEELQEEFNVEQIARVDALTDDIESVIDESTHVQSHGYVVGEVADYGVSDGTVYFELVHRKPHCSDKDEV